MKQVVIVLTCLIAVCFAQTAVHVTSVTSVPTTGGKVTIYGTGFGQIGLMADVSVFVDVNTLGTADENEPYRCQNVEYSSDHITCDMEAGTGKNLPSVIQVSFGVKRAIGAYDALFNFSYEAPVIENVTPRTGLDVGSFVTITGKNFGSVQVVVTVEGLVADVEDLTEEEIVIRLPPGVGTHNELAVYSGPIVTLSGGNPSKRDNPFDDADYFSFVHEVVAPVKLAYSGTLPAVAHCAGAEGVATVHYSAGAHITICGSTFAIEEQFGPTKRNIDNLWTGDVTITIGGAECELVSVSSTEIVCEVPADGSGVAPVSININGIALHSLFTISYGAPEAHSIVPTTLTHSTGNRVTIYGRNFGANNQWYNNRRTIKFGRFACTNVQYISTGVLSCVLPSSTSGVNLAVSVTVASLSNDVYTAPVLDTNVPENVHNLACGFPSGAIDASNFETCNCFSGFAPSSNLGYDCNVAASCPGQLIQGVSIGGSSPSRPHTSFRDDRLTIVQASPIVHGRRDFHISLVTPSQNKSAETCNYPGPIWTKTVSSLDCLDVYTMVLPWSQNKMCGFEEVAGEVTYNTFESQLVTIYRDIVTTSSGKSVRSGTVTHQVVVKFQRELTVALESTSITPISYEDSTIDVVITEDALYDAATMDTLVVFDTITGAPYQLSALEGYWYPSADNQLVENGNVSVTVTLQTPQPGDLACGNFKEACTQRWIMRIQTVYNGVSVCNLKGRIDLVPSSLCRDPEAAASACPASASLPGNATIEFSQKTELCEDEEVDAAEGLDFAVTSYEDSEFEAPQSTFQTGDVAHFLIAVVNPAGTIDAITFNSITLRTEAGASDPLYDIEDSAFVPPPTPAQFNITSELVKGRDAPLSPGQIAVIAFRVTLSRALSTLNTMNGDELSTSLSVDVVADIVYHGNENKKRVIAEGSLQKSATARIIIVGGENYEEADVEEVADEENYDFSFSLDGSASTATFSVFAMLVATIVALFL